VETQIMTAGTLVQGILALDWLLFVQLAVVFLVTAVLMEWALRSVGYSLTVLVTLPHQWVRMGAMQCVYFLRERVDWSDVRVSLLDDNDDAKVRRNMEPETLQDAYREAASSSSVESVVPEYGNARAEELAQREKEAADRARRACEFFTWAEECIKEKVRAATKTGITVDSSDAKMPFVVSVKRHTDKGAVSILDLEITSEGLVSVTCLTGGMRPVTLSSEGKVETAQKRLKNALQQNLK